MKLMKLLTTLAVVTLTFGLSTAPAQAGIEETLDKLSRKAQKVDQALDGFCRIGEKCESDKRIRSENLRLKEQTVRQNNQNFVNHGKCVKQKEADYTLQINRLSGRIAVAKRHGDDHRSLDYQLVDLEILLADVDNVCMAQYPHQRG